MSDARQASVDEILVAAKVGLLSQRGDTSICWFAIDKEHIALDPVRELIAHGILCFEGPVPYREGKPFPMKIIFRNPCGTGVGIGWHKIGEIWRNIIEIGDGKWAIDGEIYRKEVP